MIGFDDAPIATRIWPAMTSVRLPVREMGRTAAEGLFAPPKGTSRAPVAEFTPSLIERDSTAPPPRARPQRS